MKRTFVLLIVLALTCIASSATARPAKSLGVGFEGVFNLTNTTNEISDGEEVNNSTFFLRFSPRVEYYVIDNLPITLSMGIISRSLDRGDTSANEFDGLFTLGTGYNIQANKKFAFLVSVEAGGYLGSSSRTTTIGNQELEENTDTRGFGFGAGLEPAYLFSSNAQLRGGIRYLGLIGSESVPSAAEDLSVTTHTVGLSLGFFYFF